MTDKQLKPHFNWKARVGGIQSRSRIIQHRDTIIVGTCGESWNKRDGRDGVYCLSKLNGNQIWFTPTLSDVNEFVLAGSNLIVPTDAGDVIVLDANSGAIGNILRADAPVLGAPIVHRVPGGWTAIFASLIGTIYSLSAHDRELRILGSIDGGIRAALTSLDPDTFIAVTETGSVVKTTVEHNRLHSHEIARAPASKYGGPVSITATPLIVGRHAYVGYARETYDALPAVFCIDTLREEIVWKASPAGPKDYFGNTRTTPIIINNKLAIASAYTDSLLFLDPNNGAVINQTKLGQATFQQWSSPIIVGSNMIAVGRVDGVLSIIDSDEQKLLASVSLATAATERLRESDAGETGEPTFKLYPGEPAPEGAICGTPVSSDGTIYVGTTDGTLASIRMYRA